MLPYGKRTWIDIDLDRVKRNYRSALSLTDAIVTCVIKSNAYGHGAPRIARALQEEGCMSFAVSCAREALELRRHGVKGELLVMGLAEREALPALIREGVTITVASTEDMQCADEAATAVGGTAVLHLKLNTGFHRLGFDCTEEAADAIASCARSLAHCRVEGCYSHLGLVTPERDEMQHACLMRMHALLKARGVDADDVHLCDSIGLARYPAWHPSRVRVGALLFGVRPMRTEHMPYTCEETLALRTTVAQVHDVAKGEIVGYGDDMPLTRDSRIATLCAGYGDGYPRRLSNGRGRVLLRGQLCPVVGLVCMDQMMVDVTDVPGVCAGDTATLLGGGIDYLTYADWCESNRNECITILSRRPIRVYHESGCSYDALDELTGEGGAL